MERLLTEETEKRNLLARGAGMVARNKRYIFWFYVLNLTLAGLRSNVALQSSGLQDCPLEVQSVADVQAS